MHSSIKGSTTSYDDTEKHGDDQRSVVDPENPLKQLDTVNERKTLTKIDLRVVPVLCVLYLLAFLDRVNIANASIFGLKQDLKLAGNEYNTALVIFFVPYIISEIPSNALMKRFKPHVWLSGCMFMFGLTTCLQGLTQNYSGILATRFFLGLFESGMFPGCFYLLAMWYRREEAQKRYTFFFCSTTLAGAFGGLLASAIGKMDGMRGYRGWRWVFILEGTLTCVIAFLFFFMIPDFPEEVKWLSADEKRWVKNRLFDDVGSSQREKSVTFKSALNVLKDWKVIIGGFMYLGLIVPAYGYAYFAPAIIQGLGHGSIQTQLLSVPPWAAAFVLAMIIAVFSDHIRHRFIFTLIPIAICLTGFLILLIEHNNKHLQYAALFLSAAGAYAAMPIIVCWFNTNLAGHQRRAVATGWQVGFGNIGGIIAAYSFLAKDAPKYISGYSICIAFICLSAISCCVYFVVILLENRRRDRGDAPGSDLSEEDKQQLGDLNPDYRYLL
ncbi:MFS general substrate transporter [Abortiporus biennis]|nr:MFS general substrate transporter [Abortiporus biennis]